MDFLTIIVNIKAKADKIDFVKAEVLKIIDETRAEKGCVQYNFHQDNENPAHFLFYEIWESDELLQAHLNSKHIVDYLAATNGAIEDFSLNKMTKIA